MAINNTSTKFFTSGEIKFSEIRDSFGDLAGTDVRASDYFRNVTDNIDWSDDSTISPRVPDATENADVATLSSPVSISENVNVTDTQGSIVIGNFNAGTITVTRYIDGVTGTEGHAVGSIGYFVDVSDVENLNLSVTVLDTATRGSGLTASDNSIALSTGYPQTITSKRFKVAFDMTNSQGPGRQATYARSFQLSISGDDGGINGWQMSAFRGSIAEYNITQSGNDEELEFSPTNVPTWNNNLSRNVPKRMDIEGVVYANETSKYALKFSEGEYNNLTINVPDGGAIYGEGGDGGSAPIGQVTGRPGGNGGGALYVENTATYDDVSVTLGSNGQIYAGGGGGTSGNFGNGGPVLPCIEYRYFNVNVNTGGLSFRGDASGFASCEQTAFPQGFSVYDVVARNPGDLRNFCRGKGGARASDGAWNSDNQTGYDCSPNWNYTCPGLRRYSISGDAGAGGAGGAGQGFSNQSGPGAGDAGGAPNAPFCPNDRSYTQSVGGTGNPGNPGGAWGESVPGGGSGGFALLKKGTVITAGQSGNTVKGAVGNI